MLARRLPRVEERPQQARPKPHSGGHARACSRHRDGNVRGLDALILRPVPFHEPEKVASVMMRSERGGRLAVAPAVLRAWRDTPAFVGAESATADTALVEHGGSIVTRGIARVTPGISPCSATFDPSADGYSSRVKDVPDRMIACCCPRISGAGSSRGAALVRPVRASSSREQDGGTMSADSFPRCSSDDEREHVFGQ